MKLLEDLKARLAEKGINVDHELNAVVEAATQAGRDENVDIAILLDHENGNVAEIKTSRPVNANIFVMDFHNTEGDEGVYPVNEDADVAWMYQCRNITVDEKTCVTASILSGHQFGIDEDFEACLTEGNTCISLNGYLFDIKPDEVETAETIVSNLNAYARSL